jgi:hypothetical protein
MRPRRQRPRQITLKRDGSLAVLCADIRSPDCERPFVIFNQDGMWVKSHHEGSRKDLNILTLAELRVILELLETESD